MQFSRNSILKQLSRKESTWRSSSRRWTSGDSSTAFTGDYSSSSMDGLHEIYNGGDTAAKRIMVVVDETSRTKHAMIWALTHLTNNGDLITLLHIVSPHQEPSPSLPQSLASLCKACKPEVEVEALVIQGPKLGTVLSQVKKLEVSVLVLGQKRSSPFISCLCGPTRSEEFVNECINSANCLTIGVSKQSKGVSGYLINTRWQKNFWLLA